MEHVIQRLIRSWDEKLFTPFTRVFDLIYLIQFYSPIAQHLPGPMPGCLDVTKVEARVY